MIATRLEQSADGESHLGIAHDGTVAWVKRCPNPMPVPSEIEIRPFWTA
jgi:hypothetical protein